jgi:hypothetical protein
MDDADDIAVLVGISMRMGSEGRQISSQLS